MGESVKLLLDGQALAFGATRENVPLDKLYRQDNVRTPATLQLPGMIASIKRHGFKSNHPLVVSAKPDGRFLVLCGNRRSEAIECIFATDRDSAIKLFPEGTVPCDVRRGLTMEQEIIIRNDHSADEDRVPLDSVGEFLAVRQLVRAGYDTQSDIAEKMGWYMTSGKNVGAPNRSKVQQRVNLAQLPQFVQDEYVRYWTDPASSNVRVASIAKLYSAFNEEFRRFPDGNGPLFTDEWNKAQAPETTKATAGKAVPITPADAIKRSKLVGSRSLRDALMTFAGVGEVNLTDIDGAIVRAEAAEATLAEIANYLGEVDYAELCASAQSAAEAEIVEATA